MSSKELKIIITFLFIIIVVYGKKSWKQSHQHQHQHQQYRFRPAGQKMLILGIFQNCSDDHNKDTTNKNKNKIPQTSPNDGKDTTQKQAEVCKKNVEEMASNKHIINKILIDFHRNTKRVTDSSIFPENPEWSLDDIEYRTLPPLCSQKSIGHMVIDILLNKEYYINVTFDDTPENLWNEEKIYLLHPYLPILSYTRILAIIVFANEEISNRLIFSLGQTQFPIYQFKNGLEPPLAYSKPFDNYKYLFNEYYQFYNFYQKVIRNLRFKKANYFAIIFFESGFYIQDEYYKRFRARLESQTEFCFKHFDFLIHHNDNLINDTLEKIEFDLDIKLVLTFGDPRRQVDFFNKALAKGLMNLTWIFQDVDEEYDFIHRIPETTKAATYQKNPVILYDFIEKQEFFLNGSNSRIGSNTELKSMDIRQAEYLCKQKTISLFNGYIFGLWIESEARRRLWYTLFHQRYRLHVRQVYASKKPFFALNQNSDDKKVHRRWPIIFRRDILHAQCKIPACDIGYEMMVGLKVSYYGQNCFPCKINFYKNKKGNSSCIKCPVYMASNTNRDACFDTYKWNYPTLKKISVLMAFFSNILGEIFCLFAIITFMYKRDTPIIRAMDFKVTIFHLLTLSITFISLPFLFIRKPSKAICILRPVGVSTLFNLSLAFVIIKSQRLLRIFQAKLTILSENEMRRYNMYTATSVFIICAIG